MALPDNQTIARHILQNRGISGSTFLSHGVDTVLLGMQLYKELVSQWARCCVMVISNESEYDLGFARNYVTAGFLDTPPPMIRRRHTGFVFARNKTNLQGMRGMLTYRINGQVDNLDRVLQIMWKSNTFCFCNVEVKFNVVVSNIEAKDTALNDLEMGSIRPANGPINYETASSSVLAAMIGEYHNLLVVKLSALQQLA